MTFMDPDGSPAEVETEVENYDDFTNPTNLLRAPSWISASPEARPALVDRAMNAFLTELEGKRDKLVDSVDAKGELIQAPVWSSAGTLTGKGQEYVTKTKQLLQTAAQDPEGGIYMDDYSGKWQTSPWVDDFTQAQPKPKAFDPLSEMDDWRKETTALGDGTNLAAQSWDGYVAHANANITDEAAKIDPKNKELKKEWSRRMSIADFQPGQMGDTIIEKVGGQHIINPDFYAQIDKVEASIDALKIPESEKRMMRLQHRDNVEKNASTLVNAFAAADAGVLGAIVSRPLNDEFNEAMSKPGASAYEFIKANKERFNKDNYGVGQEVAETFRDALMATGTGALWLGSGGNYTSPMEAWGGLAADSGKAYNNTKQFDVFGVDINRRDLTELAGQIGSFIAMGVGGSLAGKGLVKVGASGASRYVVGAEGQLLSRATIKAAERVAAVEAGLVTTKTLGQKAGGLVKTIAADSEVILGSLQASGMSYGRTFNDAFERTNSREEAHKEAVTHGVSDGLGAFIATSIMNRFAKGAGRLLDGGQNTGGSLVQSIRSKVSSGTMMRETQEALGKFAGADAAALRKAFGTGLAASMDATSKRLGLHGFGIVDDVVAEGVEEMMDEVISGAIQSMSHDSKSWTEAEWEQIQNNWQGYIKAGVLGAIGGTAGGAQNAALNPRQIFGKSDALQTQEGIWKKIKTNVEKFETFGNADPKTLEIQSLAEYLASDKTSIQDKAQVLIASAREMDIPGVNRFTSILTTPTAPASTPAASTSVSATESQLEASDASLTPSTDESSVIPEGGQSLSDIAGKNDADFEEDSKEIQPRVPKGLKVVRGNQFEGPQIQVSMDGSELRVAPGFLSRIKKKFKDTWEAVLDIVIDEEVFHHQDILARGGQESAEKAWAQEWKEASPELKKLVATAYKKMASLDDSQKGAELSRMKSQVSRLGRITESMSDEKSRVDASEMIASLLRSSPSNENNTSTAETPVAKSPSNAGTDAGKGVESAPTGSGGAKPAGSDPALATAKPEVSSTDTLTKDEEATANAVRIDSTNKATVAPKPKVKTISSGGFTVSSHQAEMDGIKETGLWVGRDGKVTVEPRLLRELQEKHDDDSELIASDIDIRVKTMRDNLSATKLATALQRFRESLPQVPAATTAPVEPKAEVKAEEPVSEKDLKEIAETKKESESLETLPDEAPLEEIRKAAPTLVDTAVVEALKFGSKDKFLVWLRGFSKELSRFGDKIWTSAKMMAIAIAGISIAPNSTNQEIASVAELSPMVASLEVSYEAPVFESKDEFEDAEFDSSSNELPLVAKDNVAILDESTLPFPSIVSIDIPAPLVEVETKTTNVGPSLESTENFIASSNEFGPDDAIVLPGKISKWWLRQGSDPSVNAGAALLNEKEKSSSRIKSMLVSLGVSQSPSTFPWCTAFTSWSLRQGGSSVKNFSARAFLNMGEKTTSPSYGDVAVLWNNNPATGGKNGWGGHTGFVLGETSTHVILLSGNSEDSVNVAAFPKTRVLGYRSFGMNGQLAQNRSQGKRRLPRRKRKNNSSIAKLDALKVSDEKFEGSAIDAVDPEGALIVASDTIEQSQTDEAGGKWERVNMQEQSEQERAKENAVQDGMGEKIVYTYKAPKGQTLSVKVGQTVLIQGEPDSILVLDSAKNGKWTFRKVSLSPEGLSLRTLNQGVRNIQWNKTRLTEAAKLIKPLLPGIANGSVTVSQVRSALSGVMDVVSPNFKNKVAELDLSKEGASFLRANLQTNRIEVDFSKLKEQLRQQYAGVNMSSDLAKNILAADVARVLAYWVDEETLHLLTKDVFEDAELEQLYKDIAKNPEHPFYKLLVETAAERYPGRSVDPKEKDKAKGLKFVKGADYAVAAELIRKLHQLRHSGSYTERAVRNESQWLQGSINMDADETGKIGKLVNTVAALVKRYSDRIKNILAMRWTIGQLPQSQQQMLFRLDQAYRQAGVQGDVNFAREDALERTLEMQREGTEAHLKWGNKITAEHFQAVTELRQIVDQFPNTKFESVFDIDGETLAMSLKPIIKDYLEKYVADFALDDSGTSAAMQRIDALLADINDEKSDLSADQTGFERAKTLVFLNRQVMEARMAAMDFDITPALELGGPDAGKTLSRIRQHIDNTVPKEQQAEDYRQLSVMHKQRVRAIEGKMAMLRLKQAGRDQTLINAMDPRTNIGRRSILATAKRFRLENPFDREGINPNDVTTIMKRLKARVLERSVNLEQHSSYMGRTAEPLISTSDDVMLPMVKVADQLQILETELADARRSASEAEAKSFSVQWDVPEVPLSSQRMSKFMQFKEALDTYNGSIQNLQRLAFGDVWTRPKEFGLGMRDLNREARTGRGEGLSFPTSISSPSALDNLSAPSIAPSSNKNDTFGVRFEDTGRYLGFRPKLHWYEEGKGMDPLTPDQVMDNQERAVIEIAGNSNAAYAGRMQWLQFFVDWVDGKIGDTKEADTYWHTGGFALPKDTNSEIGADRYRAANAFRTADVKMFNDLVFKASNEAQKLAKGKGDKNQPARKALIAHVSQMEAWAKETVALVSQPKEDIADGFAPLITELGGKQTLAGRVKGLIESQFNNKAFLRQIGGETETNGLIRLLDDLQMVLTKDHGVVAAELFDGMIVNVRARLDGANDAARLTNKALIEFRDQQWRDNVAFEGSRWQREASYTGDNAELERLRDAPIDARILSNLSWLMKFHEKQRDYVFGSNFAFELLEMINRSNRGEGVMPMIYNKTGNITDPNVFDDDKRTNRSETVQSMMESLDGDRVKTAAEVAIDQAAGPENQRRMALTGAALMIGSQSNGDTLDIDAGRAFLFDLWAMENDHKSRDEQRQLVRKGIRGTFPLAKSMSNPEAFYDEMEKELSNLTGQTPSVETVLVSLLELKQSFEATIVEEAKAGHKIGRALAVVKLAAGRVEEIVDTNGTINNPGVNPPKYSGGNVETDEEFIVNETVDEELLFSRLPKIPNAKNGYQWAYRGEGWQGKSSNTILSYVEGSGSKFWSLENGAGERFDSKHYLEQVKQGTPKKPVKRDVKKYRKVAKSSLQTNSMASPEESDAIARMLKGSMTSNDEVMVYDASMLVHGIDGIGNPILSQLIQTFPGETLVVSPKDSQVTRYGLDDVGFKIFPGTDGGPNVVYSPSSQKNPDKNATESFGGIAQSLKIASKNEAVRGQVAEMARIIRLSLDPAVFPESIAADPSGHLSDVAELGRTLRLDGDGGALINMFGDDQSTASDILIVAEVLTNPKAKELFDKVYIGVDGFADTLLAEPVELALQEGIRNILRANTGAQEHDQDHVDRATEESVTLDEEESDNYNWYDSTPDAPEIEALKEAKTFEELQEIMEGRRQSTKFDDDRKANRFGPDAPRINKRLAKELQGNGLNPSDAFLFNGLARIIEQGKAAGGVFPMAPSNERTTSDILSAPLDPTGQGISTDKLRIAVAGPALQGNVEKGLKAATKMYVGEMRNLTIPKVSGRTSQNIAFQKRNIDSTNSSLLLRAPAVRTLVGAAVVKKAISKFSKDADASGFGLVDVNLPLDDAMMESIRMALPAGVLDAAELEAKLSLDTLEKNQTRLNELREALLAEIGAYEADNGQAFQELLDNSPEGANLLATAKDWSESLKAETRDMVVAHVTRFAEMMKDDSGNAANLGHVVHLMLTEGMENNPQLKAAVDGLYKQANAIGALVRERNTLLTPDENNELPQGDTQGINSRISDAARLFNLHVSIFNSHAEMHARQVMRWTGVDPKKANLSGFRLKTFKETDDFTRQEQTDVMNSLSGMLNGRKFAQGFMDNMVREITQGVTAGAKPKMQTNAFMRMVSEELMKNETIDLPAFIDEEINKLLDSNEGFVSDPEQSIDEIFRAARNFENLSTQKQQVLIGVDLQRALQDIALTTNQARALLSSKARSVEQEQGRKEAAIYLGRVERELEQTRNELSVIDSNKGKVPVGMGYYSGRASQGQKNDQSGGLLTKAIDEKVTYKAQLTLTNPLPPVSDDVQAPASASSEPSGTMSRRDYWIRQKAVITALTEQSENRIEDAYKFVRGSRDQFMNFDPLKAINQAVDLVQLEEQIVKEVMQDAHSDAQEAQYKGMTADAAAYLSDPEEALTLTRTAQNRVKQINLPKSHQLRKEKLGVLINQEGEKVIMMPLNARELLMQHFPKITKRNVNREMERIILDALPVNQGVPAQGSYSYFLAGTEKEVGKDFDGADFSPAKQNLKKGEAAKAFSDDWRKGMQTWLDDAMSSVTGAKRTADLTGDVSKKQLDQFGYMIERLVIAHGDTRLSDSTKAKIKTLLKSIDSGEFAKVGGSSVKDMDVSRMLAFRVEPVFSLAFAEIEAIEIQKCLITDFVSFDGKKHALELGALKFLHHQDARIRSKFRRNFAARQAAIHLQDFIEYGIDGTSGRQGYETSKKAEEEKIVKAAKPIGNNAKDQTIGYLISVFRGIDTAFGMHRETATNRLVTDIGRGLNELENLNRAQGLYFGELVKGPDGKAVLDANKNPIPTGKVIPKLNRYWNADNLDMIRDLELAREVRGWMLESGISNTIISSPEIAKELTDKFIALLESKVTLGNEAAVEGYAQQLNRSFADISSAMQLTMAMLSQDAAVDKQPGELLKGERMVTGESWRDDAKEAFKITYSSVPLRVGYAARPDPAEQQVSSDRFIADPIDMVSLKDSSFFGGYGKGGYFNSRNPFRPISLNGLTAPLSLLDDAIYKLNVTPTYEVLRRSLGRVVQDEHGVNTIKDGDFLNKANEMIPDDIDWNDPAQRKAKQEAEDEIKKFRQALSAIAEENETILQNDAANGVSNTGGAEAMRFLGSLYIVRALASLQQVWNQTTGPSVGYAAGKIAVGKGKQAAQYFSILQKLITDRKFNEQAREFVRKTDRSVYYRSADGADVARDIMHSQVRFGKSTAKNLAGKGLREYEKLGEKALHWTIGKGESYLSTAMFIVELADQMKMEPADVVKSNVEPTAMAKSNARRKVNDVMAQSDQSKKSWMFQNRTSSPGRNALWRSMVRFSNHTSSMASNTSVLVPILFDEKADAETKKEALENVVTSLTQNILFYPFKLQMLVPMVSYLFFLAGGDDDDKAQKKAQKLANEWMFVDKKSSMLGEVIKTITFGNKRELFDQTKKADAAQASAFAEIASRSLLELTTAVPVLGVMAGYAPVSGLVQKTVTNPMAIAGAAGLNNTFNRKQLKAGFGSYDKNGVTIRSYKDSWHGSLADLTAPTAMAHDALEAGVLTSQYLMSREAQRNRAASLLDAATYLTFEAIPFAREPRAEKRAEMREVIRKENK